MNDILQKEKKSEKIRIRIFLSETSCLNLSGEKVFIVTYKIVKGVYCALGPVQTLNFS